MFLALIILTNFNPRSPCGERLEVININFKTFLFQSTLPVWGATTARRNFRFGCRISIHAPRVGSDTSLMLVLPVFLAFQSTLPVWGATGCQVVPVPCGKCISIHAPRVGSDCSGGHHHKLKLYFNPRSPCGERQLLKSAKATKTYISIHAPRVGSDPKHQVKKVEKNISIHAPRVGSD